AAATDAAPSAPSGMGPSTGSPAAVSSSSSAPERRQEMAAAAAASPAQGSNGSSPRPDLSLRSSIVEKPLSFKKSGGGNMSSQALSGGTGKRAGAARTLLRVKSLEEQVASLAKQSSPAYRWPGGAPNASRPSANVR
ncbi:hypothetical protein COCSUDRAFT_33931, partial [Coccomyxa subellipsoidea C-169]